MYYTNNLVGPKAHNTIYINREHEYIDITKKKKKKNIKKNIKFYNFLSMMFYILKSLHDIFIINFTSSIFFNVYSQTIIHPMISHLIDLFQIC